MSSKIYNITFSINREYLLFMCVTLYSLLRNNQKYFFNIYIIHNNCLNDSEIQDIYNKYPLNQYNNFKIHLINVSSLTKLYKLNHNSKWTQEIYFKLFLPQLLPNVDKILHLDTDILIRDDIKNFLDTEMINYLYCSDVYKDSDICVGVLLCNLKLAREINTTKKTLNFIKKQKSIYKKDSYNTGEEYAINHLFKKYIFYNNDILNLFNDLKVFNTQKIIHFVNIKPWNINRKVSENYRKLYSEYYTYLKDFNKYSFFVTLYGYYAINCGYIINSLLKRIKGFIYKYILKKQKYQYIHKNLFISFLKKTSLIIK